MTVAVAELTVTLRVLTTMTVVKLVVSCVVVVKSVAVPVTGKMVVAVVPDEVVCALVTVIVVFVDVVDAGSVVVGCLTPRQVQAELSSAAFDETIDAAHAGMVLLVEARLARVTVVMP